LTSRGKWRRWPVEIRDQVVFTKTEKPMNRLIIGILFVLLLYSASGCSLKSKADQAYTDIISCRDEMADLAEKGVNPEDHRFEVVHQRLKEASKRFDDCPKEEKEKARKNYARPMEQAMSRFLAASHKGLLPERRESPRASPTPAEPAGPEKVLPYLQRRQAFHTKLLRKGPAPQRWEPETPPAGVEEVSYPSGQLKLKAWIAIPNHLKGKTVPALVYFHGGFAFGSSDWQVCKPFRDAGFAVMCPMLRGENGNPGHFELFFGEVDDAKAAIRWLAARPEIEKSRIYTFGHSAGGAISALLSLHDDVPIRHGGSSGGAYPGSVFYLWKDMVPFDLEDLDEHRLRLVLCNMRWMQHTHYAYFGVEDGFKARNRGVQNELKGGPAKLKMLSVPGDHHSSLGPALAAYLKVIQADRPQEGK
jgi:pimeloyl-ACP methyl ester carboxylesterase